MFTFKIKPKKTKENGKNYLTKNLHARERKSNPETANPKRKPLPLRGSKIIFKPRLSFKISENRAFRNQTKEREQKNVNIESNPKSKRKKTHKLYLLPYYVLLFFSIFVFVTSCVEMEEERKSRVCENVRILIKKVWTFWKRQGSFVL